MARRRRKPREPLPAAADVAAEGAFLAPPAGLPRRLGALLYDGLLLLALVFLATLAVLPFTGGEAIAPGNLLFPLYLLALCYFFLGWQWVRSGQTLGLRTWRLRIVQPDGSRITWRQALVRFGVGMVSLGLGGLGFLWALFDGQKRTWQDLASGTVVVHEPKERR